MGMDLKPQHPTADAPRDEHGHPEWGRYNWSGWSFLVDKLAEWGLDVKEFAGTNDGDLISAKTCRKVADLLERHKAKLPETWQRFIDHDIVLWRTCGGYRQY